MSFAFAAVDKFIPNEDPNTLCVPAVGNANVYGPPEAGCVTTKVPLDPTGGVAPNAKVLFAPKVTLAFNPDNGVQVIVAPAVNAIGVEEYTGALNAPLSLLQ
jgi:hypothetical protein